MRKKNIKTARNGAEKSQQEQKKILTENEELLAMKAALVKDMMETLNEMGVGYVFAAHMETETENGRKIHVTLDGMNDEKNPGIKKALDCLCDDYKEAATLLGKTARKAVRKQKKAKEMYPEGLDAIIGIFTKNIIA